MRKQILENVPVKIPNGKVIGQATFVLEQNLFDNQSYILIDASFAEDLLASLSRGEIEDVNFPL
jgi:hypothetical protein